MASLSLEEENYVRMSLLLSGICPRAARALFDREFNPLYLDETLKKEYNTLKDLQKKRIINQQQMNLLFPRRPDVPKSDTFDITLIITLLRNITRMIPPRYGYDCLPSATETTPCSDLARIKYYNINLVAHNSDGKVDTTVFRTAWEDLSGKHYKTEMAEMKQSFEILSEEVLKLKSSQKDTAPWNIGVSKFENIQRSL
ncbi:unnamed protein product [Mytilus edulis]|uniref:DZIP3-like HEPN domain-containing protein n=1 Tax=Mytilus edulis TaxID=6550 RepID=A0A8S3S7I0_MYTED|nr:unnamed protein product [Mytilus edulis]